MRALALVDTLVAAVADVLLARGGQPKEEEIAFRCPLHDDDTPSASWNAGRGVWHCFGCGAKGTTLDLARVLELGVPGVEQGLTVERLAEARGIPVGFLSALGVLDGVVGKGRGRRCCVDIPYLSEDGQVLGVHKRLWLRREPRFIWRRGDHTALYGLWRLRDARVLNQLLLVEGESDCWALWHAGIPALGIPGASTWRPEWATYVAGIERVLLWREPDTGGDTFALKVAATLPDVRVVEAPADAKDPSALWLACDCDLERFRNRLRELAHTARPWAEMQGEERERAALEALGKARFLLEDPALLARVGDTLKALGLAGERANALMIYLALSSRVTDQPLSAVLKGPSAAGKSFLLGRVAALFPGGAIYSLTSASEKALVYTDEDLRHRTVIIAEDHEMSPFLGYALRSLLSEGRITYEVVEKTQDGLKPRKIEKAGPTNFVTTTTKAALHSEMETRLVSLELRDDPEQTAAVLQAVALRYQDDQEDVDLEPWRALQRWLGSPMAAHRAIVPYASALARALSGRREVRLRRDFGKLLTAIATCAVLHQLQRGMREGVVVADIGDYAAVREIMAPIFGQTVASGLTTAQRDAVEAVAALHSETGCGVSYSVVAQRLELEVSSSYRRLQNPLRLGYVVNEQQKRRGPALLVPGTPLPEEEELLPSAEAIQAKLQARVFVGV